MNQRQLAVLGRSVRSSRKSLCGWMLVAAVSLSPAAAWADGAGAGEKAKEAALGAGSALISLVYAPVKLVYATCGVLVGGLAYAFSGGDAEVANVVLTPSVLGTYVISPAHLTGQQEFEFFGRDPGYRARSTNVAVAPLPDDPAWEDETW